MDPSAFQPVAAQPEPSSPLDNRPTRCKVSMAVGTDNYTYENALYTISRLGKFGIIFYT